MQKPTKALLVGLAVGSAVVSAGYVDSLRSKSRMSDLINQCQIENKKESEAIEIWRNKELITGLPPVSSADVYAQWIVTNKDKKGTPDFNAVARAYKFLRRGALACDAASLQQLRGESELTEVQAKLLTASEGTDVWFGAAKLLAAIFVFVAGMPYLWYFLLRRLREIREAIVGK